MADRAKQIKEIAQEIRNGLFKQGQGWVTERVAEHLYNAGYRKQSEPFPQAHENGGEWIVTDADSGSFGEYEPFIEFKCPKCESVYGIESGQYGWEYGEPIPWVACPLCGAKMKGGE